MLPFADSTFALLVQAAIYGALWYIKTKHWDVNSGTFCGVENVSKMFNQVKALDNFTIWIEDGITTLLGQNGAGKSTLL